MKKYLAYDACDGQTKRFESIEEARKWIDEQSVIDESVDEKVKFSAIYILHEKVEIEVTDKKSNYKYQSEDDIPEDDNESEAWPYSSDHEEMWKINFVQVNNH